MCKVAVNVISKILKIKKTKNCKKKLASNILFSNMLFSTSIYISAYIKKTVPLRNQRATIPLDGFC